MMIGVVVRFGDGYGTLVLVQNTTDHVCINMTTKVNSNEVAYAE